MIGRVYTWRGQALACAARGRTAAVVTYLTDGRNLYEVVLEEAVRNYGRLGGWLRHTIIRDCLTEEVERVGELRLMTLRSVSARSRPGIAMTDPKRTK